MVKKFEKYIRNKRVKNYANCNKSEQAEQI